MKVKVLMRTTINGLDFDPPRPDVEHEMVEEGDIIDLSPAAVQKLRSPNRPRVRLADAGEIKAKSETASVEAPEAAVLKSRARKAT